LVPLIGEQASEPLTLPRYETKNQLSFTGGKKHCCKIHSEVDGNNFSRLYQS
jgi:hypothetical protein